MPNSPRMSGCSSGQILQAQQITFEIALIVQVNVETAKIDILRKQIFRRRISRVGKEHIRIDRPPDANQLLDKFRHAPHAEPAHHRAGDFVADQITKDCRMSGVRLHGRADSFGDLFRASIARAETRCAFPREA